jgi:hypothetical protein
MIPPSWRIIGLAAVALALTGSLALNARQASAIAAQKRCVAAVGDRARPGDDPRRLCPPAVAGRWAVAVRSLTCDAALALPAGQGGYGVATNCSTPVKTLHARAMVAGRERDAALADLAQTRRDQVAAIRRAEAAARLQTERSTRAAAAVQSAPRSAAGRVVCDADCLSRRRASGD